MDEFVCVTVCGRAEETESAFKSRLIAFWSDYLRTAPDDYEQIFAEASEFESTHGKVSRQYMVTPEGIDPFTAGLARHNLEYQPIDHDDLYSKYEAAPPDWFQLDHG